MTEEEHRLELLLGKQPGTLHAILSPTSKLPEAPEKIAIAIPAETLRQRPDIREAECKLAAETAQVGAAKAACYPRLNLTGEIGLRALTPGGLFGNSDTTSSLLTALTAPIFDAGKLYSQVVVQDAIREQVLASYEQTVLTALQEVENALLALVQNRERASTLEKATDAANEAAVLARKQYTSGVIDFQTVLDTERSKLSVEDSLASARADAVLSLILLYKALGGGWYFDDQ